MQDRMRTLGLPAALAVLTLGAGPLPAAGATARPQHVNPTPNPILGFPESWGLTRHDVVLIGAGLLIAALLFLVLVLRVRRRRHSQWERTSDLPPRVFPQSAESWRGSGMVEEPTRPLPRFQPSTVLVPEPEPGWHPVQGDRSRIAYWDGTSWAAFREWDGTAWVEPSANPR